MRKNISILALLMLALLLTGLEAQDLPPIEGGGTITVRSEATWDDNSGNEDGFAIYYTLEQPAVDGDGSALEVVDPTLAATVAADATMADIELPSGERYWIVCRAYNDFGWSIWSNPVELDYRPPEGAGNLRMTGERTTTVTGTLRIDGDLIVAGRISEGGGSQ